MLPFLLLTTVIAAPEVQYRQPQVASGQHATAITFGVGNAIYTRPPAIMAARSQRQST